MVTRARRYLVIVIIAISCISHTGVILGATGDIPFMQMAVSGKYEEKKLPDNKSDFLSTLGFNFAGRNVIYVSNGDGATDTRTGLSPYDQMRPFATVNAAGDAMSAGDVLCILPSSTPYTLTKTLLLPSNSVLDGLNAAGTTLTADFDTVSNTPGIIANTGFAAGTGYTGNTNITIRNITINHPEGNGITPAHVDGLLIENVRVGSGGIYYHLLDILGCKNVVVRNAYQNNGGVETNGGVIQIDAASTGAASIWDGSSVVGVSNDDTACDTVLVEDSYLVTDKDAGFWIHRANHKNITLQNSYISAAVQSVYSDAVYWESVAILNNYIGGTGGRGIHMRGENGNSAKNLKIHGNTIVLTGDNNAVQVGDCNGTVISNNYIQVNCDAASNGALCFPLRASQILITGNTIINTVAPASQDSDCAAIRMSGASPGTECRIIGNTISSWKVGIIGQANTWTRYIGVDFNNVTTAITGSGFLPCQSSGIAGSGFGSGGMYLDSNGICRFFTNASPTTPTSSSGAGVFIYTSASQPKILFNYSTNSTDLKLYRIEPNTSGDLVFSTGTDAGSFTTKATFARNGNLTVTGDLASANLSGTNTGDQNASQVAFTPSGDLSETDVQGAITEVASFLSGKVNLNDIGGEAIVTSSGTAHTFTITSNQALDFGTTDPVLNIEEAGTWEISAEVVVFFNGATFGTSRDLYLKLRRTNNTAADLTGAERYVPTGVITTFTGPGYVYSIPIVNYITANTDDEITICGLLTGTPSAGSVQATEATIRARKIKGP